MAEIPIYGELVSGTSDGILTLSNQIKDTKQNKTQEEVNKIALTGGMSPFDETFTSVISAVVFNTTDTLSTYDAIAYDEGTKRFYARRGTTYYSKWTGMDMYVDNDGNVLKKKPFYSNKSMYVWDTSSELLVSVSGNGNSVSGGSFYNVDVNIPLVGSYYSKETAVAAVSAKSDIDDDTKHGMIITFWDNDNSKWRNYRYKVNDLSSFADPEYWETFTAGEGGSTSDYRVVYTPISNQSQTVGKNTTGIYVKYKVDIVNSSNVSTGELINCQITVRQAGGSAQSFSRQVSPNTQVDIKLDSYISTGLNTITIKGIGSDTGTVGQYSFQVICVSLSLTSDFDLSTLKSKTMAVPYSISGDGNKTVEFFIDGVSVATDTVVASSASNTKTLPISGLSLTRHSLQIRASVSDVTYGTFYSNTLYFDFFVNGAVSALLGVALVLAEGTLVTSGNTPAITGISQFGQYSLKIAAYNPSADETNVTIYENSVSKGEISVANNTINEYVNVAKTAGTITLLLYSTDSNVYQMSMTVSASQTDLVDITDSLQLDLSALGRTNTGANKNQWKYTDAGGNLIETTFSNVPFNNTCGWVESKYLLLSNGGLANVGLQMLKGTDKSTGKTIEMEFKTANVMDENAVVASCMSNGTTPYGLKVTASSVVLTSQGGSTVETKYKAGENVRIGLVIHSVSDTERPMLIDLYVDGEHSGCTSYLPTDTFSVNGTLSMGSIDADLYVKTIKVYGKALNDADMLNNYTIDRDDAAELIDIYNENSILTNGKIDINKVNNEVPIVILTGDVDTLVALNNKTDSVRVTVEYRDVQNTDLNFTQENVKLKLQGTSSLTYPRKNFKFTLNSAWALRVNSLLAKAYCLKADFAESSGTHNTGVAKMWNGVLVNAGILTEAQVAYNNYCKANSVADADKKDVRTTVDGKPIVLFWKKTADSDIQFIGKYNLNTDKAAENTFGFKDIPGFDFTGCECWEFLDNTNPMCLFSSVDNWTTGWKNAFERRYPDDGTTEDTTELNKLCTWLVSVNPFIAANDADKLVRLNKFYSEVAEWFDVSALCAYYLYTEYFGAVDQRAKNCMLATYGNSTVNSTHKLWRFINYDNDTVNGLRNDGLLKYDYLIDENTIDTSINDYAYAGHNSGLWECLRRKMNAELIATAQKICSGDYPMSYANALKMFNETQMGAWCKRIYNLDGDYKYVQPYLSNGSPYLYAMQGSRSAHRRWWLYNRFAILNSKYSCGDFRGNYLSFLAAGAPKDVTFNVTVAVRMYLSWGYNNQVTESSGLLEAGSSYTFTNPVLNQIGNVASVYGGGYIRAIDLSNMAAYLARVDTNNIGDENNLISLILGKSGVTNTGLVASSFNISNATKLQTLNVQGMTALTGINLTKMTKLKTLLMENSGISTVSLAESAPIETLHYGASMLNITLKDMTSLTTSGLSIGGYTNIISITITGCKNVQTQSYVENWLSGKSSADGDCSVDIDNIAWTNFGEANLLKMMNMSSCKLKGVIALSSLSATNKIALIAKWGDIDNVENALHITYPRNVELTIDKSTVYGGIGTLTATVKCTSADGTLSVKERGSNAYFTITEGERTVDNVNKIVSQKFTFKTTTFPTSGGVYIYGSSTVGTTVINSADAFISGTSSILITSIYIENENHANPNKWYETSGTHRLYCKPACSDGSSDFKTTTDGWEIQWNLNILAVDVEGGCVITEEVSSLHEKIFIVSKNGTELARIPKYQDVSDKTLNYVDMIVSGSIYDVDNDTMGGTANAAVSCALTVIGRTTAQKVDNQGVILHAEYYAVQSYNSTLPNYNPAVCIILQKKGAININTHFISNSATGEYGVYMTMEEAEAITSMNGFFAGSTAITTVTDTNGVVQDSYVQGVLNNTTTYNFDRFDELRFFKNLDMSASAHIYYNGFSGASKLKHVRFSPKHKILGQVNGQPYGWFRGCSSLELSANDLKDVEIVGAGCFSDCTLLNLTVLPDKLTQIGSMAFYNTACTFTEIPDIVTYCPDLIKIKSTSISYNNALYITSFSGCSLLENITFRPAEDGTYSMTSLPNFEGCSALKKLVVPSSVTYIAMNYLRYLSSLEKVVFSSPIIDMSNGVFYGHNSNCKIIVDSIAHWLSYKFNDNEVLHPTYYSPHIYVGDENTYTEVTDVYVTDFPSGLTKIQSNVFNRCANINVHALPDTITTIGVSAFFNTKSDISVLPSSLISCGNYAFSGTNATFSVIPDTVTSWGDNNGMKMTSLSYPNTMTAPGGVGSNNTLTNVIFRKNEGDNYVITTFPSFRGSTQLVNLEVPASVTAIQYQGLFGCSNLANLYVRPLTPPTLGSGAFSGTMSTLKIHVYASALSAYTSATGWSSYASQIVGDLTD